MRLFMCTQKASIFMAASHEPLAKDQSSYPVVLISYECITRERLRESTTYVYEVACSITYPATFAHISVRLTSEHTYRNAAVKDVPFTRHEAGATTYIELLEAEQFEVRVVGLDGSYAKAIYVARGQELTEQQVRGIVSTIQRIDARSERE
jgi:hypothetical protein